MVVLIILDKSIKKTHNKNPRRKNSHNNGSFKSFKHVLFDLKVASFEIYNCSVDALIRRSICRLSRHLCCDSEYQIVCTMFCISVVLIAPSPCTCTHIPTPRENEIHVFTFNLFFSCRLPISILYILFQFLFTLLAVFILFTFNKLLIHLFIFAFVY